ncbi:hypothetical protein HY522_08680 [bacterium]|nr:hypothetical protein [bacterium]
MTSAANSEFHRFCLDHPRLTVRAVRDVARRLPDLHALFGKTPTPFSLTPYIFTGRNWSRLGSLCANLAEIFETVGRRVLSDGYLLASYAFPPEFLDILRINPPYRRLAPILRLDGHFVDGVFRLVETNADGSAGMNDSNAIERAALESGIYSAWNRRMRLRSVDMVSPLADLLVRYGRRFAPSGSRNLRIGILDIPGVKTASEFTAVRERLGQKGVEAVILTTRELNQLGSINLIYRRLVTRDALAVWKVLEPLLRAVRRRKVCLVGSFRSEILHSKAILALVQDPKLREALGPAERKLIARHVPKAVPLTPETAEEAACRRIRWVLKPLAAYGSQGVVIGRQVSAKSWKSALQAAVRAGAHLLQEYVPAPVEPVLRIRSGRPAISREMTSVGFFLYDGKLAGPYVRSGPRHPLSISYGAVTRPGFVLEKGKRGRRLTD